MPRNQLLAVDQPLVEQICRAMSQLSPDQLPIVLKHGHTLALEAITDDPMDREEFLRWGLLFADTSDELSLRMAKCYSFYRFGNTDRNEISLLRRILDNESWGIEALMWWRSTESERKVYRQRLLRLVPREGNRTNKEREIRAIKREGDDWRESIFILPSGVLGHSYVIPLPSSAGNRAPTGMYRYVLRTLGLAKDSHDNPYHERLAVCQREDCRNVFLKKSIAGQRGGSYRLYCSDECKELMKARTAAGRKAASRAGIPYREWLKRQAK